MSHVFTHTFKYIGALLTLTHSNALLLFHNTYTEARPHFSPNIPHFKSASCVDFQVTAHFPFLKESPRACHLRCHNSVKHGVALAISPVSSACDPLL